MKALVSLVVLGLVAGCTGAQPTSPPGEGPAPDLALIADGRDVAVRECSHCHALDGVDASPNPNAPPMSDLLLGFDAEVLASDLIEGVRVGHDEMPEFDFTVKAADALVAYLQSIKRD